MYCMKINLDDVRRQRTLNFLLVILANRKGLWTSINPILIYCDGEGEEETEVEVELRKEEQTFLEDPDFFPKPR